MRMQPILMLFVLVLSHESLALYDELIAQLHLKASVSVPGDGENNVVTLTFEKPTSAFHLDPAVIVPYEELKAVNGHCRDFHPLTVLLYINYRQTEQISFRKVNESERPLNKVQIDIVAKMYDFIIELGEVDKELLKKVQFKIAEFIDKISEDKYKENPEAMVEDGLINETTALLIAPHLARQSNKREKERKERQRLLLIEVAADKLIKEIDDKQRIYNATLQKMSINDVNAFIVIKRQQPNNEHTSEIWKRACEKYNADHATFSLNQVDTVMSCGQCCSCFWCFIFCCPCACSKYCCHDSCACDEGSELQLSFQSLN